MQRELMRVLAWCAAVNIAWCAMNVAGLVVLAKWLEASCN